LNSSIVTSCNELEDTWCHLSKLYIGSG
jgi:hypothetical protein